MCEPYHLHAARDAGPNFSEAKWPEFTCSQRRFFFYHWGLPVFAYSHVADVFSASVLVVAAGGWERNNFQL